jgi:hypothetical protein
MAVSRIFFKHAFLYYLVGVFLLGFLGFKPKENDFWMWNASL